jgi:hypothetical protein
MPDTVTPAQPAQAPPAQPVQRGELERVPAGTRAQRHARGQAHAPGASTTSSRARRITRALTRRLDPYLALLGTILGGVLVLAALTGFAYGRVDRALDQARVQLTATQACTAARAQVTAAYDTARATEGAAALHEKAEETLLYQAGRMKQACP